MKNRVFEFDGTNENQCFDLIRGIRRLKTNLFYFIPLNIICANLIGVFSSHFIYNKKEEERKRRETNAKVDLS